MYIINLIRKERKGTLFLNKSCIRKERYPSLFHCRFVLQYIIYSSGSVKSLCSYLAHVPSALHAGSLTLGPYRVPEWSCSRSVSVRLRVPTLHPPHRVGARALVLRLRVLAGGRLQVPAVPLHQSPTNGQHDGRNVGRH